MNVDWLTDLRAISWLLPVLLLAVPVLVALCVWTLLRARRPQSKTRRSPAAVVVTGFAAACCTAYSADTSWRFAEHDLGMVDAIERGALFAAGEIALLAVALMARHNKTHSEDGSTGTPGTLIWVITGVQVIPAFSESGLIAGAVRAFFGPVLAALLWHLAMDLELQHLRPGAFSKGLAATIGREVRERALSWMGFTTRDRTADQITRDRAMHTAVRLAARRWLSPWGKKRLAAALTRAGVAADERKRVQLIAELEVRKGAEALRSMDLNAPWTPRKSRPAPPRPAPRQELAREELRRMHPLDAVRTVHAARPGLPLAEIAALCAGYGITVTETMVRIAVGAGNASAPEVHLDRIPQVHQAPHPQVHAEPHSRVHAERTRQVHPSRPALVLDLKPMDDRPSPMAAPVKSAKPLATAGINGAGGRTPGAPAPAPASALPGAPAGVPVDIYAKALKKYPDGPPSVRRIKAELGVGQDRAKAIHRALKTAPAGAPGGTP